jgi:DNA repair exonuclease SbcCD nuclease subunit
MEVMRRYAMANDIDNVIVCGDLFHDRVNIGIDVGNAIYHQLMKNVEAEQDWYCFDGNHDMFLKNSWEISSLRVLTKIDNFHYWNGVTQHIKFGGTSGERVFHIIPFVHYESKYMEILKTVEDQAGPDDVLLTHIGVNGATLNECFLLKNWNIVNFTNSKFKRVFVGHFHCHQIVGENVWYPGSPIPFRFDEGVVPHGFLIYDLATNAVEFKEIMETSKQWPDLYETRPPEYLTIVDEDLKRCFGLIPKNHIRVQLSRQYTHNELQNIRTALEGKLQARSVSFVIPKQDVDEDDVLQNQLEDLGSSEAAFKSWLLIDQPKDIDDPLVWQCFKQVQDEADERIAILEEASDDA